MKVLFIGNLGGAFVSGGEISDEVSLIDAFNSHVPDDIEVFDTIQRDEILKLYNEKSDPPSGYDVVIICKWHYWPGEICTWLRTTNRYVVYWCFDLMMYYGTSLTNHDNMAAGASGFFSKEYGNWGYYRALRANFIYMPLDTAPDWFKPSPVVKKDIDILFTGHPFGEFGIRDELLLMMQDWSKEQGWNFQIYGAPDAWGHLGLKANPGVYDSDYGALVARAKVNLAIDWNHDCPGYWSNRIAKIMSCGGTVLTKYTRGMYSKFGDGVAYFETAREMFKGVENLLQHDDTRARLSTRALEIAEEKLHTRHRVNDVVEWMKKI